MSSPRDTLSVKLAAARKRHALALRRVAAEEATIDALLAKKRAHYTRELRRTAHWPKHQSRAERDIDALIEQELGH